MSVFKDFSGLENLKKFKNFQGPTRALTQSYRHCQLMRQILFKTCQPVKTLHGHDVRAFCVLTDVLIISLGYVSVNSLLSLSTFC